MLVDVTNAVCVFKHVPVYSLFLPAEVLVLVLAGKEHMQTNVGIFCFQLQNAARGDEIKADSSSGAKIRITVLFDKLAQSTFEANDKHARPDSSYTSVSREATNL